jgi:hypothetical protein
MNHECWYFLTSTAINLQAYRITVVAFTGSIQGIVFPQGMEVFFSN